MNVTVLQNQTIQDVATMYTGSSEHYLAILLANGKTDATLYIGEQLTIPDDLVNTRFVEFYNQQDVAVACSPEALDPAEYVPAPPLPNSDVTVRLNGIFVTSVNAPQVADIPLVDSNDNPVAVTATGGVARVPNVVIEQRNSLNEVQGTFEFTPGTNDHIESPNATVVVKDFQGVPQSSTFVASGKTHDVLLPNPNVNVTVNGEFLQATQAPSNPNVILKDSNGDPAEFTIEDGEVIVPASSGGGGGFTKMPYKTGQTISYHGGDDGDLQSGQDFFLLPAVNDNQQVNHFGNKWRFTGVAGGHYDRDTGQYKLVDGTVTTRSLAFPDGLRIDHASRDWNDNVMMWYFDASISTENTWSNSLSHCNSFSILSFTDGWKMPSLKELMELWNTSQPNNVMSPKELMDNGYSFAMWSSTTVWYDTNQAHVVLNNTVTGAYSKSSLCVAIPCRITNISEL